MLVSFELQGDDVTFNAEGQNRGLSNWIDNAALNIKFLLDGQEQDPTAVQLMEPQVEQGFSIRVQVLPTDPGEGLLKFFFHP